MKSESLENRGYGGEMATTRLEHDALGDVQVPADRLWGAQTQRSLEYFAIGVDRFRFTRPVIRALGLVKKGAARANHELGELDAERARLIEQAADRVIDGEVDAEFPLVVFQTGSGTQSNMNANEVIANLANLAAGLNLYYAVQNVAALPQQWLIANERAKTAAKTKK